MKLILLAICLTPLLTTTGCLVAEGGRRGHNRHEEREIHSEIIVPAPEVIVRPPTVIIR